MIVLLKRCPTRHSNCNPASDQGAGVQCYPPDNSIREISVDKSKNALHWIVINRVDNVIHLSNNRGLSTYLVLQGPGSQPHYFPLDHPLRKRDIRMTDPHIGYHPDA